MLNLIIPNDYMCTLINTFSEIYFILVTFKIVTVRTFSICNFLLGILLVYILSILLLTKNLTF